MSKSNEKISKFLSYYKPYSWLLAADLTAALLVAALALLLPLCVRQITNGILASDTTDVLPSILRTGALMLVIIVVQTLLAVFYDYKGHDMGAKIERDMRQELFAHYQKLPFSFFDGQKTGQLMSRITNDLLNLAELYHHGPENLVVYGIQFVGSFVILLRINWKLTLVICAFLPMMALYSFIVYKKMQNAYRVNREQIADVNARVEENLSGIRIVKSFSNERLEVAKFGQENGRFYRGRSRIYAHEAMHFTVIEKFFTQLITVAIVVTGGFWISKGDLDIGNLLIFTMYAVYLTGPVPKLAFMVQQYQEGLSGYRRFREIVDLVPLIQDAKDAQDLVVMEGRITFEDVSFRYHEEQEYVLNNISFEVAPGDTIAIVGHSGIGKTTLCSLIPRFYEVNSGSIGIDGVDVRSVTQQSLRQQIGVVRQEMFLFSGTILENILYGKPDATREEAIEAAKKANAHEFIMGLAEGYDTNVGQRGVKLSGGQQQRISIARVFLKNPPILIFDEATSALDYDSERAVLDSLKTLSKERTTFVIAHRASTTQNADRILILSKEGLTEKKPLGNVSSS